MSKRDRAAYRPFFNPWRSDKEFLDLYKKAKPFTTLFQPRMYNLYCMEMSLNVAFIVGAQPSFWLNYAVVMEPHQTVFTFLTLLVACQLPIQTWMATQLEVLVTRPLSP